MLAAVFIGQGFDALRSPKLAADAARPTLEGLQKLPDPVGSGVPGDAETFAKVNAAVQIGGGLLLATGRMPRLASAALAATVIPANLGAHMFWNENDQQLKAQKRREFLTDISLLGGLIIASADTAGKPSLGWRGRRAARKVAEAVTATLPSSNSALVDSELADRAVHGLQAGAERGRELALVAGERTAPLLEAARKRGAELADVALERGAELADAARGRGAELADAARELAKDQGADLVDTTRSRAKKFAKR
jgi:uncharacterized membrane protein YphA (DoxX/SURF4 family)